MRKSKWLMPLVILLVGISLVSCRSLSDTAPAAASSQAAMADPSNPCGASGPVINPNAPILCIDDLTSFPTITIDPPPATYVHLYTARTVHWFTKSGSGTIAIAYDSDLLDPPDMKPGKGHTKAKAKSQTGGVKYSVFVQKGSVTSNVIDPTIIIDTCCG